MGTKRRIFAAMLVAFLLGSMSPVAGLEPPLDPVRRTVSEGASLYRKGDLMGARAQFQKALRLSPNDVEAQRYLDRIDRKFRAIAARLLNLAEKNRENVEEELSRILTQQPRGSRASRLLHKSLIDLAKESGRTGSIEDLLWLFERPLSVGPAAATHQREELLRKNLLQDRDRRIQATVSSLLEKGRWEEAIDLLEGALEKRSGDAATAQLLASVRSRYAKELMQRVSRLYAEAQDLHSKGDNVSASERLRDVLRIQPLHIEASRLLEKIEAMEKEPGGKALE